MKGLTKNLVLVLAVGLVLVACKQPTQQITDAQAVIDEIAKAGADKYAAADFKALGDAMKAAQDEIATQDKKLFKKFGTAKDMLAKVKTDAEALKAALPGKIEAAKNAAIAVQTEAKTAIDEAKALLEKAPKGKGTKKDIEALQADLAGAETAFTEIQTALDAQDYLGAADKAKSVKEKAAAVADQVKAAIEKTIKK
jgi:hypothetical protein